MEVLHCKLWDKILIYKKKDLVYLKLKLTYFLFTVAYCIEFEDLSNLEHTYFLRALFATSIITVALMFIYC
jgi:hypothetical protein